MGITVLSLFDGISCGRLALERAEIGVNRYYASEIDKYAIKVSRYNFSDITHVGTVGLLKGKDLPEIDLLIGGSPCQGFSVSGNKLNFDDPRSRLFFEYVRILKECSPKWFLLENVKMRKDWIDAISDFLGVSPININSNKVSAQNRERLYWTNIPSIAQPHDKKILLKDIIEKGVVDRDKPYCIDANYYKGGDLTQYFKKKRRQIVFDRCLEIGKADIKGRDSLKRVYSINGKAPTLTTMMGGHREPKININSSCWRKLTPIECERLQTLPDNYTRYGKLFKHPETISDSQRYKMVGNGWTVDVIAHIFKHLKPLLKETRDS